jgi:hypothetical protein
LRALKLLVTNINDWDSTAALTMIRCLSTGYIERTHHGLVGSFPRLIAIIGRMLHNLV